MNAQERRWKGLARLVELRAPENVLIIATRAYLAGLEGNSVRAIRRWAWYRTCLAVQWRWDRWRMWFLLHVLRMSEDRAENLVFGVIPK